MPEKTITRRVLRGVVLNEGYRDDFAPRRYAIVIVDGRAWDADAYAMPTPDTAPLVIDADGTIGEPGVPVRFLPDDGELDRVGREHFGAAS